MVISDSLTTERHPATARTKKKTMIWTILPVCVFLLKTTMASIGSIGIPTVEYNSAKGQIAHASSFYDYTANPHYQYKYEPKNAIDGLVAGSR